MEVLPKDIIRTWILPHLRTGTRGCSRRMDLSEIVETILFKLKTGCQWQQLPVNQFFTNTILTCSEGYYRFNEWRKDASYKNFWVNLLQMHRRRLNLSSVQLDGNHALAKNGVRPLAIGAGKRPARRTCC